MTFAEPKQIHGAIRIVGNIIRQALRIAPVDAGPVERTIEIGWNATLDFAIVNVRFKAQRRGKSNGHSIPRH